MSNFILYCKDFEKYKNRQEWTFWHNHKEFKMTAVRNEDTYSWQGFITRKIDNPYLIDIIHKIAHGGIVNMRENRLGFSFSIYTDYKPRYEELGYYKEYFDQEKIENFRYWTFPEVKIELEKIATYYKSGEAVSS